MAMPLTLTPAKRLLAFPATGFPDDTTPRPDDAPSNPLQILKDTLSGLDAATAVG